MLKGVKYLFYNNYFRNFIKQLKNITINLNMVHGNYYGVQYEIYLNKMIDLFDDVLPICIDVRKMISFEKIDKNSDNYKLVIIPYREFDKRFEKREHVRKYMGSLDTISYNHQITRKSNPEEFKYYDVKIYEQHIKYSEEVEPFSEEMFDKLENKVQDLSSKYNELDYWEKYSSEQRKNFDIERGILMDVLKVQRIIRDKEYFEEIKQIEHELTNIKLTEEEEGLVLQVLHHPKLEGIISSHGINLINGYY